MHVRDRWGQVGQLWRDWLKPTAVLAAVVLPLKSAVADWNWVPTGSMKPTILEGDLVLVNKLAYDLKVPFTLTRLAQWDGPVRGDIVVFFAPSDGTRMVKRVMAVSGDTIEMRNNVILVNGKELKYEVLEPSVAAELQEMPHSVIARERDGSRSHFVMAQTWRQARRSFAPVTVPPGKYFVMGDSRDNSLDSRYIGLIDRASIVGRARRVLLSLNKNGYYEPRFKRFCARLDP